jgi:hypothetical protein
MTDPFNELFDERMKTIATRLRLNKLIALNLQLFNTFVAYARQNNIPLTFNPRILSIIKQIEREDLNINISYLLTDEKKHPYGTD